MIWLSATNSAGDEATAMSQITLTIQPSMNELQITCTATDSLALEAPKNTTVALNVEGEYMHRY